MMRAAIYARFSTELQRDASIEDQLRLCRRLIQDKGWVEASVFCDRGLSGASHLRPAYQDLMGKARLGHFDVVVAESIDRLSRDQEHIAAFHKAMCFLGIPIVTMAEGAINELHIGLKGTMSALYLKDLAQKTKRGLEGRILQGRSGGGNAYGYDVIREFGPDGPIDRGRRVINPAQADVIRQIYAAYLSGQSPRAIAHRLNRDKVPGPRHQGWTASTLIGNRKRGTGILNNELYLGRLIWNRQRFIKDPTTGKRQARPNPPEMWITQEVQDLAILDPATWEAAQKAQAKRTRATRPDRPRVDVANRRPKHLFSGLIKCGGCGGGVTMVSGHYYGCAASKNKGTCENRARIAQPELEEAILSSLQADLLTPELTQTFITACVEETASLTKAQAADTGALGARIASTQTAITNIVDAIASGRASAALTTRLASLEDTLAQLTAQAAAPEQATIALPPDLAQHYQAMVQDLRAQLTHPEAIYDAMTILRTLITEITLQSQPQGCALTITGALGPIIHQTAQTQKAPQGELVSETAILLVAGAHSRRKLPRPFCLA